MLWYLARHRDKFTLTVKPCRRTTQETFTTKEVTAHLRSTVSGGLADTAYEFQQSIIELVVGGYQPAAY
jgi:hypothetical protein